MVINLNEQYNDGCLPDIFMLTQAPVVAWLDGLFKAALYTIVPRSPFLLFVLQNISGYKNAVECLLQ